MSNLLLAVGHDFALWYSSYKKLTEYKKKTATPPDVEL